MVGAAARNSRLLQCPTTSRLPYPTETRSGCSTLSAATAVESHRTRGSDAHPRPRCETRQPRLGDRRSKRESSETPLREPLTCLASCRLGNDQRAFVQLPWTIQREGCRSLKSSSRFVRILPGRHETGGRWAPRVASF